MRHLARRLPLALGTLLLAACAYNASGVPLRSTLIFEYSIEAGPFVQSNNLAYYLVFDTNRVLDVDNANDENAPGTPRVPTAEDAPLVNGPAPLTHPYPDPRSYLPFARDQRDFLDREPVQVPRTYWTDFFAMFQDAGQLVMWQGRKNPDGTVNERFRQLQQGREWGLRDDRTVQITIPLDFLNLPEVGADQPLPAIEGNLAVATRGQGTQPPRGFIIDRWGQVQNQFFRIQTRPINETQYDTVGGVTFPENLQGYDPRNVRIVSFTYRVVGGGEAAP